MSKEIKINAGELSVGLQAYRTGLRLISLQDKKFKKNLLSRPQRLFTLTAERLSDGEKTVLSSDGGWRYIEMLSTKDGATVVLGDNKALTGITVTLTAVAEQNEIRWRISFESKNSDYTVISCDYPALSFDTGKNVRMFYPYGCGEVYNTPKTRGIENSQNYPSYGISMGYMAFYNVQTGRGVYYGLHDTAPAAKRLSFKKNAGEPFMYMVASQPTENQDRGCNSQTLYGECVWKLFDGDWYDAAVIYRTWAEQNAEFMHNAPRKAHGWFEKEPHWWLVHIGEDESFADDIIKATEELGTDSAVHLYLWHNAPFDNDYPHYFPVRECAKKGLKKLHDHGIKVMPYINGRLWDTRDRKAEDYQFTSVAKPWATKDRHGVPFTETYSSKEEDGSKVCLSIMCPSSALWQEKMAYTVGKLVNEEGFDAVYMDQIAAAQAYPCCDRAHPHPAGGGTWWCRSYRALLDRVYRELPENTPLTTECTADPFVSHMAGYLSWLWIRNDQVPAFSVIYSKYITMFGRSYQSDDSEDWAGNRIFMAQSLCYGEQLGWIAPKKFNENPYKDFYTSCVRIREKLGEYFYVGSETLRPPVITSDLADLITEKCSQAINGYVREKAVLGCHRKSADGKQLLLVVNASDKAGKCQISLDIPDGVYGEFVFENGKATVNMDALSVKYIEF